MADDFKLPEHDHGPNPLPIETVRDLLGIVRVMYALHTRKGNHGFAKMLRVAGRQLRRALEIAIRNGNKAAHEAAWRLADEAISTIARVRLGSHEDLAVAVELASERVRTRHYPPRHREAKRLARIKRG